MLNVETREFKRIDKRVARRLYNAGVTVHLLPCKVMIGSYWFSNGYAINIDRYDHHTFDQIVINYAWYNCNDWETGYYTSYFIAR